MLKSLICVTLLLVPTMGVSKETTYRCDITAQMGEPVVPLLAIYTIDTAGKTASVYDPVVHTLHQAPIPADLSARADGVHRLKWRVEIPGTRSRIYPYHSEGNRSFETTFTARYIVDLNPKTRQMKLRGNSQGIGLLRGVGTCAVQ